MQTRRTGKLTILILRDGGRAPIQVAVSKWLVSLVHTCALTLLGFVGTVALAKFLLRGEVIE